MISPEELDALVEEYAPGATVHPLAHGWRARRPAVAGHIGAADLLVGHDGHILHCTVAATDAEADAVLALGGRS